MTTSIFMAKHNLKLCLFVVLFLLVIFKFNDFNFSKNNLCDTRSNLICQNSIIFDLSSKLNKAQQAIGRLSCSLKTSDGISLTGGWCSKFSSRNSSQHITDENFAKALSKFLKGKKVASFGDGPGVYKEKIDNLNQVILYDAFDGAPYAQETTEGRVKHLDLSVPIYHLNTYDWVVSIEVAEHIPKEFEHIYVDNLIRHANEGIILSWAKEGQGGLSHVNLKNFDKVKLLIESKKYMHDLEASNHLKSSSSLPWIRENVNVFRKKND